MSEEKTRQIGRSAVHRFGVAHRVAWTAGPQRDEGEGVVTELLPPTPQDGQPRYRIRVFVNGEQTEQEIELVDGVVFEVPGWATKMERDDRLRYHQGRTPPWNEEIETG